MLEYSELGGVAVEVLMCVGTADVQGLFRVAVRLVQRNCPWADRIHVVTPEPRLALERLAADQTERQVIVHTDHSVVPDRVMNMPGWFRQQYIKLHADLVCGAEKVVCIGADTLVLNPIAGHDLFQDGLPILRFFRYNGQAPHLAFERTRIRNVAAQLNIEPSSTWWAGDFICDVFPMAAGHLRALRSHLDSLHGIDGLAYIMEGLGEPRRPDNRTGEWSMYTVFVLDVLRDSTPLRLAERDWACQIHTSDDLARSAPRSSRIIHFVHEPGGTNKVLAELVSFGRLMLHDHPRGFSRPSVLKRQFGEAL